MKSEMIARQTMLAEVDPAKVDYDLENRILRNVVPCTDRIATDGCIFLPLGLDLSEFSENPQVLLRHGVRPTKDNDLPPVTKLMVIGRVINSRLEAEAWITDIQFADTELGREAAYLYGLNQDRERYMRGWSVMGYPVQETNWTFARTQQYLGDRYDAALVALLQKAGCKTVRVALSFRVKEFSAVERPADRGALSRAAADGIGLANEMVTRMDLQVAGDMLVEMKEWKTGAEAQLARLDKEIKALRRNEAAAAARGNAAAIVRELRDMCTQIGNK